MFKVFQRKVSTPVVVVEELVEVVEVVEVLTEMPMEEVHKELMSKEVVVVVVEVEVVDKEESMEKVLAVVEAAEVEEVLEDVATEITVRQSRPAMWSRSTRSARA